MSALDQFKKQQYLNLETFRKNGEGVKTPVWFTQDGEVLYVVTGADSGKVKRIRRSGRVNIAPCKMDGGLTGDWVTAQASVITDEAAWKNLDRLFKRKYGLIKKITEIGRGRQTVASIFLEIRPLG
jgi:PPOX class probable F420-dependent enzyme